MSNFQLKDCWRVIELGNKKDHFIDLALKWNPSTFSHKDRLLYLERFGYFLDNEQKQAYFQIVDHDSKKLVQNRFENMLHNYHHRTNLMSHEENQPTAYQKSDHLFIDSVEGDDENESPSSNLLVENEINDIQSVSNQSFNKLINCSDIETSHYDFHGENQFLDC